MKNLEFINSKVNSSLLSVVLVLVILYLSGPIIKTIYEIGYNFGQAVYKFLG